MEFLRTTAEKFVDVLPPVPVLPPGGRSLVPELDMWETWGMKKRILVPTISEVGVPLSPGCTVCSGMFLATRNAPGDVNKPFAVHDCKSGEKLAAEGGNRRAGL